MRSSPACADARRRSSWKTGLPFPGGRGRCAWIRGTPGAVRGTRAVHPPWRPWTEIAHPRSNRQRLTLRTRRAGLDRLDDAGRAGGRPLSRIAGREGEVDRPWSKAGQPRWSAEHPASAPLARRSVSRRQPRSGRSLTRPRCRGAKDLARIAGVLSTLGPPRESPRSGQQRDVRDGTGPRSGCDIASFRSPPRRGPIVIPAARPLYPASCASRRSGSVFERARRHAGCRLPRLSRLVFFNSTSQIIQHFYDFTLAARRAAIRPQTTP